MPVLANARHERFAQFVASGMPGYKAYMEAGYNAKNEEVARKAAFRVLANADVSTRISELQERAARTAGITVESLINEADMILQLALSEKQSAAAVAALTAKAKLAGLWEERSRNTNDTTVRTVAEEPLSPEEWARQHGAN